MLSYHQFLPGSYFADQCWLCCAPLEVKMNMCQFVCPLFPMHCPRILCKFKCLYSGLQNLLVLLANFVLKKHWRRLFIIMIQKARSHKTLKEFFKPPSPTLDLIWWMAYAEYVSALCSRVAPQKLASQTIYGVLIQQVRWFIHIDPNRIWKSLSASRDCRSWDDLRMYMHEVASNCDV